MQKRLAVVAIMVEDATSVQKVNALLSEYGSFIVGRMGLPNVKDSVNVISLVMSAQVEVINALTGKLGSLKGVTAKTLFSKN
ncbi:MAG: iron-only hydrogenase system regulator [Clostridia bacterium]|nr:iron-only hydrogenase system regulator [Clostridia bacterium]